MCGRFTHLFTWQELQALLALSGMTNVDLNPRYNIAPSQEALILRRGESGEIEAAFPMWGIKPSWANRPPAPINAKSETIATSPMFRSAFAKRRCIVPASGFYEWEKLGESTEKKPAKQPWYIARADGQPLMFAGIFEATEKGETFAIVTTAPNAFMSKIHNRMPAILEPEQALAWLDTPDPTLLHPAADGVLAAHRVSSVVNKPANDAPDCIAPM